jgi:uncharacterized pyridoxal phosphate-containing UPF0001 family protein
MTTQREVELAESLAAVRARLDRAAAAAGRDPEEIELLPVTKFFPASDVILLRKLGCAAFGESREPEASNKVAEVAAQFLGEVPVPSIRWHMVGRIQRNKARTVAGWAHAAHSVDSAALLDALGRAAVLALEEGRRTAPLGVYLQLSLDGDPTRGGVAVDRPDLVDELCALADGTDGLDFVGLRTGPGTELLPAAARSLGRHVGGSRDGGGTRLDLCACRYRSSGRTSSNVSLSSHSSHIFITDNTHHGHQKGLR